MVKGWSSKPGEKNTQNYPTNPPRSSRGEGRESEWEAEESEACGTAS